MYHLAEVIDEVVEFARKEKEKGNSGTVYIQEKEVSPGGEIVLGDEDTGNQFEEQIRLILETTEGSMYFVDDFEEMLFYKQALEQIEKLKEYYPLEWVSETVIEQKREQHSDL